MIAEFNKRKVELPDFIIVGVSRSGTKSLYRALIQHPRIFFPPRKEPFFFNGPYFQNYNEDKYAIGTIDEYIQLFSGASEKIIREASIKTISISCRVC